ncbi:hypothetical protein [Marinitenerispora sediminis]|uniref:Uncharacterized protein n=1 Tax=Marinitenerispora sediminis TaxID=1931232 RepID=A0A368T5I6_9ACTN|nr:hypothetical protein [Marinitenerispora sediminis]RCV52395.1 hypothetical protein DEF23_18995 [Marinitenerispora sediminis]RCV53900.1 hypothetical protein DEF28_09580 [Marinitenerispora sediminis]RCV58602.1 hypothetical protein DEF24_12880 [Marinitenerispora sediminis]
MTLWAWVGETAERLRADGHPVLADTVAGMPRLAAEGDVARLKAELPSALRAARDVAGAAWLPAYLRHWPVWARVNHRMEGTAALADAEALLRAAHADGSGPAAHGCCPAACPAENVLACYANIDGPGHAVDRAALLTALRAHVQPGQPAFESLALAHADMLVDDERPEEAVRHLDGQAARVRDTGTDVGLSYGFGYVRALRHLDRFDDALAILDHLERNGVRRWPRGVPRTDADRRIRFERARLLAWLARTGARPAEDAVAALPDVREAEAHPYLRSAWTEAVEHLVERGAVRNDWRIGVTLTTWARHLERVGSHRPCLELSLSSARLAAARGARWVAHGALRRAQRALSAIRRGDDLRDDLVEAREYVERIPAAVLPVPAENLLAHLRGETPDQVDPENQADLVLAALTVRPDDTALLNALGQVGRTLMLTDVAVGPQWERVRRAPGDRTAALALLESLLHDNDTAGVRTLIRTLSDAVVTQRQPA